MTDQLGDPVVDERNREITYKNVNWIELAQGEFQWWDYDYGTDFQIP
jgi:hypothetical protein